MSSFCVYILMTWFFKGGENLSEHCGISPNILLNYYREGSHKAAFPVWILIYCISNILTYAFRAKHVQQVVLTASIFNFSDLRRPEQDVQFKNCSVNFFIFNTFKEHRKNWVDITRKITFPYTCIAIFYCILQ